MTRSMGLLLALMLIGCASRSQTTQTAAPHDGRLESLRHERRELAARVNELDAALLKLQDAHPGLDHMRESAQVNALQVAQSLTAAKLESIDTKSKYASGHPAVQAAIKREAEIYAMYQEAMKKLHETDKLLLERDRLAEAQREQRDALRRLDERIARLEDRGA